MKKYEAIFILDDQRLDDGGTAFVKQVEAVVVELGGKVESVESMGQRQMAYAIRNRHTGTYWDIVLELDEDKVLTFKERFRREEVILRLQLFIYDRPEKFSLKETSDEDARDRD